MTVLLSYAIMNRRPDFVILKGSVRMTVRLHIIPGSIACFLGPFCSYPGLPAGWINLHRYSAGFKSLRYWPRQWMVCYWLGMRKEGQQPALGFCTLTVLWFYSGTTAFLAVRAGNIKLHNQWMIHSYTLTLACMTLILQLYGLGKWLGLSFDQAYDVVAWFNWRPNLVIAEWLFIPSPLPFVNRAATNQRAKLTGNH